ncbi:MAG: hypothetical protein JXA10_00620, partial [Anaerolineae bacterium]|nr:hypothetical protein [Anaerolineae bacterium]
MTKLQAKQRADLTYKYNQKQGRHGWLRLTPAYSIKAVLKYLKTDHVAAHVLDPFSGTGTTGLLCAELGITCDLLELNPFLVWFTQVKTRNYTEAELQAVQKLTGRILAATTTPVQQDFWTPPIRFIERWWSAPRLIVLAHIFHNLQTMGQD